jgi:hypothetical protein
MHLPLYYLFTMCLLAITYNVTFQPSLIFFQQDWHVTPLDSTIIRAMPNMTCMLQILLVSACGFALKQCQWQQQTTSNKRTTIKEREVTLF